MHGWAKITLLAQGHHAISQIKKKIPTNLGQRIDPSKLPPSPYRKLEQNEFRLLVLLHGHKDDPIRVEIEHANILHERNYAALSYVWHDNQHTLLHPILINSTYVYGATYNLWQALKRIRAENEDTVLWVDQICINQEDEDEKGLQIQYMTHIYRQAHRVLCWLGDDDGSVAEAFATLTRWATAYADKALAAQLASTARQTLTSSQPHEMSPLGCLFSRPYFSRAWCLQEVCVDTTKPPIVLCGQNEISWHQLHLGFFMMTSSLPGNEVLRIIGPSISCVIPMLSISWNTPEKMSLSCLIPLMGKREATVPQDKIFSVLGLAKRNGQRYPAPKYDWTMDQVCVLYTRAIIETEKSLDILRAVCPSSEADTLPSWSLKPNKWRKSTRHGNLEALDGTVFRKYYATRNMKLSIEPAREPFEQEMRISGFEFDRVARVHDLSRFLTDLFRKPRTWPNILERSQQFCTQVRLSDQYTPTGEDMIEAFLKVLSCDYWSFDPRAEGEWYHWNLLYDAYYNHANNECTANDVSLGASKPAMDESQLLGYMTAQFSFQRPREQCSDVCHPGDPDIPYAFLEERMIQEFEHNIERRIGSRKLFVTKRGLIGVGLEESLEEDVVCLIPGSAVPLLLRERQSSDSHHKEHVLIGDAYVHGIMYGEGLEDHSETCSMTRDRVPLRNLILFSIV